MSFETESGLEVGRIGQGTWHSGEDPEIHSQEVEALQAGIEAGLNLIDTAEMYGDGQAEILTGQAIQDFKREDLFLVSKVYPWNAGRGKIIAACENSLKRLGTDYLDLYLLHWIGSVPLEETIQGMEELKRRGWIRRWGVSNFDTEDMEDLFSLPDGSHCQANQCLYHLGSRGVEFSLLPWMKEHGMVFMAYSPLGQDGLLSPGITQNAELQRIAARHGASPYQIMLAFLLEKGSLPIPKSSSVSHTLQNAKAVNIHLSEEDLKRLDWAFPPPEEKTPLDAD